MTTSLPNSARHSAATLQTCMTASGSSAFTWKIGASTTWWDKSTNYTVYMLLIGFALLAAAITTFLFSFIFLLLYNIQCRRKKKTRSASPSLSLPAATYCKFVLSLAILMQLEIRYLTVCMIVCMCSCVVFHV